ncbi:subclass B3 metallo-beta-lactamase [Sphingomonas koreensis]|nr:subclass B3 metallo-beta-lactamase [Sphingomonas koreensis]
MGAIALSIAGSPTILQSETPAPSPAFSEHDARCAGKEGWSDAAPPVHIFGNIYDVGTCGIVVLLLTGPDGDIVIDAAPADATPGVLANIERLGIRLAEVKVLLSSHEHVDHAGGLAGLQRRTGAKLMALAAAKSTLETGIVAAEDPQRGSLPNFDGVHVDRVLRDGDSVNVGPLHLTAHATPGHSPGSTTWSWKSCEQGGCRSVVYADSVSAVSSDKYRFADHPKYVAMFRRSIAKIAALTCDLIITPHPGASDLYGRLAGKSPISNPKACRDYAATGSANLDSRLASESATRTVATRTVATEPVLAPWQQAHSSATVSERSEAAVRDADDNWGKAEARGDAAFVDWLLLPEYQSVDPTGKATGKNAIVAGTRARGSSPEAAARIAAWRAAHPTRAQVTMFGDTAILTWISLLPATDGRISSSDIFVYRDGHWHAIYSQHSEMSS